MFLISLVAVACNAVLTSPRATLYNYPHQNQGPKTYGLNSGAGMNTLSTNWSQESRVYVLN